MRFASFSLVIERDARVAQKNEASIHHSLNVLAHQGEAHLHLISTASAHKIHCVYASRRCELVLHFEGNSLSERGEYAPRFERV